MSLIKHIYNYRVKSFLSFDDFKHIFNIKNSDFLKYYTLIKSIPLTWQTQLQNENINLNVNKTYLIDTIMKRKTKNNILYKKQIDTITKNIENKSKPKRENEFQDI